jgi:hypothetical protein
MVKKSFYPYVFVEGHVTEYLDPEKPIILSEARSRFVQLVPRFKQNNRAVRNDEMASATGLPPN